tara:strand:- start:18764 stop:18934 length:171 start_codon:yes stop_codon:yes gene_type:complete
MNFIWLFDKDGKSFAINCAHIETARTVNEYTEVTTVSGQVFHVLQTIAQLVQKATK